MTATTHAWSAGYLEQARADLRAAEAVLGAGVAPSAFAMLLQMVFEKLAKAALLRSGAVSVGYASSSHRAASQLVAVLKRNRLALDLFGSPFAWDAAAQLIQELERVHPSVAKAHGGPQLEYPWETPEGDVHWPEQDLPVALRLGASTSTIAIRVLTFAKTLASHFDAIFPL